MSEACIISIQGMLIYLGHDDTAETYRLIFESLTYPCLNCTCLLMIIRDPTLLLPELGLCRIYMGILQSGLNNLGLSVQMERFFLTQQD